MPPRTPSVPPNQPQLNDRAITAVIGSGPFQAAIRGRQAASGNLTALAALTLAADRGIYATGVGALALYTLTGFGRMFAGAASDAAARTILALGNAAVRNVGTAVNTVMAGDDSRVVAVGQLVDSSLTATVTTTDATPTVCGSITPADGATVTVTATVSGNVTGTSGAGYVIVGTFRRSGATTTQVGATTRVHEVEDVAGWDAVFGVSGASVRVLVTGAGATTVVWRVRLGVVV